jgi:rhamnogalacturonyl hydrolase YesR
VARHYSIIADWSTSYPETTGYIVPTMLAYANLRDDETARERARQMLDWLVSIQFPAGGFQGGLIDAKPRVPVTFNTGQILIGLASGAQEFKDPRYHDAMCRAADWLVKTQDPDGCWRKHPTPFAKAGEKAYETHVAWGLFEAARIKHDSPYADAAVANVTWALRLQRENGWFDKCCLTDPSQPLTHTVGYVLRGIIEAYKFTNDSSLLKACCKTADGLLEAIRLQDGFLPGRVDRKWNGTVSWSCLTGSVQIAQCLLMVYQYTGEKTYRDAAYALNQYVRRSIRVNGSPEIRGGIKGSFPINGGYGTYQYLNWACKFFVDSNMLEKEIRES